MNATPSTSKAIKGACAMLLALTAGAVHAQLIDQPAQEKPAVEPVPGPAASPEVRPPAEVRPYKSYGAAALEILGFQLVLNRVDHAFVKPDDYGVSVGSIRRNLHSGWVEDRDPFEINQMGHPYQGSVYFNIARANGLTFWESMGYAFAGSAVWEIAGETTPPSRNDQITTSFGGSFLGEALYRMASMVLDRGDGSGLREAGAAVVSPALGYNRQSGRARRAASLWAGAPPATFTRLQLGASSPTSSNVGPSLATKRREVAADFAMEYGLPGKDGYTYHKPFDYFLFRARVSNVNGLESLTSRGLLWGAPYREGERLRGIAGIYGSYDYLSPQLFRIASTGVSVGSNAQLWVTPKLALQGHVSTGVGYTATGTIRASSNNQYHYGFAPLTMLGLRVIYSDRVSLDLSESAFLDGKVRNADTGGDDRVLRGDASLTYRISGQHAVALKYLTSRRKFSFPNVAERQQRYDSVGLYYTWVPSRGMGAVNW